MRNPFLEDGRGIAEKGIELPKRRPRFEPLLEPPAPEGGVSKYPVLQRTTRQQVQPLHPVRRKDIVTHWGVHPPERRGYRHDRGEVRWKFLCSSPLHVAHIRAAPHRDFAAAIRLPREPLYDVMTVLRLVGIRLEFPLRIATAANVHGQERVASRSEIHTAIMMSLPDVRCQYEYGGAGEWGTL